MATQTIVDPAGPHSYIEWGPIFAGAIGSVAISFLLLTFGASVGLSLTSAWPDSGAPGWVIALGAAWWAIMVQAGSMFSGGYLAGRMRARWGDSVTSEAQFRDGTHGFMVWAVAVLFGGALLAYAGGATLTSATQATATVGAGAASGHAQTVKTAINPSPAPAVAATDLLLRPAPRTPQSTPSASTVNSPAIAAPGSTQQSSVSTNSSDVREEINRVFAATIYNRELTAQDRDYLVQVVVNRDNVSEDEARKRVDAAVAEAQKLENDVRATAEKARKATLITGFIAVVSLLISLAVAVGGAHLGGSHRDEGTVAHLFGHRLW
jgi:hypothetical protein